MCTVEDGDIVVGGDFNLVGRGARLRQVAELTQTQRVGPSRITFWLEGLYPMQIDHVLAPKGGRLETRGWHGSDHMGLLAYIPL